MEILGAGCGPGAGGGRGVHGVLQEGREGRGLQRERGEAPQGWGGSARRIPHPAYTASPHRGTRKDEGFAGWWR